jgi:hypothetical protein
MKITDFTELIRCMPYREHAFEIKKSNWLPENKEKGFKYQNEKIEKIFEMMNQKQDFFDSAGKSVTKVKDSFMISRNDLFYSSNDLDLFIIKVLMWGYPTKGRGKNIENILNPDNFDNTVKNLEIILQKGNISNVEVKSLFSDGLKLSTVSKFLYFLQIRIESFPALILDSRVINALTRMNGFKDEELKDLRTLTINNAPKNYAKYLKIVYDFALKINVKPDQFEMFLFEFGSSLKELTGEEGDLDSLND